MLSLVIPDFPKPEPGTTSFFMVTHTLGVGEDETHSDVLIEAVSPEQAAAIWRRDLAMSDDAQPDCVYALPMLSGSPHALQLGRQIRLVGGRYYEPHGRALDEAGHGVDAAQADLDAAVRDYTADIYAGVEVLEKAPA